jgi:Domain of unknown function (DUF397)
MLTAAKGDPVDHAGEDALDSGGSLAPGGPGKRGGPSEPSGRRRHASAIAVLTMNGVRASALSAVWHKSSFSGPNGDCVEAAELPAGVAVRNSRFPDGPALLFTDSEWSAFLRGVKGGDFG